MTWQRTSIYTCILFCMIILVTLADAQSVPTYDHVVIVVEENHSYSEIIGNLSAPYINGLATSGANFTNAFGIEHPSQPNYLDIFSGSNQGITNNGTPGGLPFSTMNLGASLVNAGKTFTGYSESMPSVGFTGDSFTTNNSQNQYMRKHNPWVNWQDDVNPNVNNHLVSSTNQPFTAFPSNFNLLPTVAIVAPNEQNDMHDGSIATGDSWLSTNVGGYANWASSHNSLLIVLWDEDDSSQSNQIPMIFFGAKVRQGNISTHVNHFDLLRTVEDMYSLPYAGASVNGTTISSAFVSVPEAGGTAGMAILVGCSTFYGGFILLKRNCTFRTARAISTKVN